MAIPCQPKQLMPCLASMRNERTVAKLCDVCVRGETETASPVSELNSFLPGPSSFPLFVPSSFCMTSSILSLSLSPSLNRIAFGRTCATGTEPHVPGRL